MLGRKIEEGERVANRGGGSGSDWMNGKTPRMGTWELVLGSAWDMNGLGRLPGVGGESGLGFRKGI